MIIDSCLCTRVDNSFVNLKVKGSDPVIGTCSEKISKYSLPSLCSNTMHTGVVVIFITNLSFIFLKRVGLPEPQGGGGNRAPDPLCTDV